MPARFYPQTARKAPMDQQAKHISIAITNSSSFGYAVPEHIERLEKLGAVKRVDVPGDCHGAELAEAGRRTRTSSSPRAPRSSTRSSSSASQTCSSSPVTPGLQQRRRRRRPRLRLLRHQGAEGRRARSRRRVRGRRDIAASTGRLLDTNTDAKIKKAVGQ